MERYDGKLHEERNKSELKDKLVHDEKEFVETGKKEGLRGSREVPVLFEETEKLYLYLKKRNLGK